MDNTELNLSMGWLVGFIEGEGCFELRRQTFKHQKPCLRPKVVLCSTDFELIDRSEKIINEFGIHTRVYERHYTDARKKPMKELYVDGIKRCSKFLALIIPHMTISRKRDAAITLKEYCDLRLLLPRKSPYTEKEYLLGLKMKEINGYSLRLPYSELVNGVFDKLSVTTIPKGSTSQAIGDGNEEHPVRDEDIV